MDGRRRASAGEPDRRVMTLRGRLVVVVSRLETIMGLLLVEGRRREGGGWTAAGRTLTDRVYVCVW